MATLLKDLLAALGITVTDNGLLVVAAGAAFLLGYLLSQTISKHRLKKHQDEYDDQLDRLSHSFNSISQQALKNNNESFLTLAQQRFQQLQDNANHELKAREQSIANLLQPIRHSMEQTDKQLRQLDQDRKVTETKLGEQIANLLTSQHSLQSETRNLVTALRRPEVRGQWGELTLKRLVELAGMSEYCDFEEQISVQTDNGQIRPDMVIRLPSNRQLVVDVKTPLNAYIDATEAIEPHAQQALLEQHCRNVKQRIKELALKQYWQQFDQSPDFVILFIPGDQFLSAALDQEKELLEYAFKQRILLATPTSLIGLLRAVAYGWSQDSLNKNSLQIKSLGEALYNRLQTLTDHLNKLGKHLNQSVEQFNKLAGSYQRNTLPAARKLSEHGISSEPTKSVSDIPTTTTRHLDTPADEL